MTLTRSACILILIAALALIGAACAEEPPPPEAEELPALGDEPDAADEESDGPDADADPHATEDDEPGVGRRYPAATLIVVDPVDERRAARVLRRWLAERPHIAGDEPIGGHDPDATLAAGLGEHEYLRLIMQIEDAEPTVQGLLSRGADGRDAWSVVGASVASDVSFPCSWPEELLGLWMPGLDCAGVSG